MAHQRLGLGCETNWCESTHASTSEREEEAIAACRRGIDASETLHQGICILITVYEAKVSA